MELGFSTIACPDWDFNTIIQRTAEMGFEAIELRGLPGCRHLPACRDLTEDPSDVQERCRAAGVRLVCLASSIEFTTSDRSQRRGLIENAKDYLVLAGQLKCWYVRFPMGTARQVGDGRQSALINIAESMRELVAVAAANNIAILLENAGNLVTSRDMWYVLDAVDHPSLQCAWNPLTAAAIGEDYGLSIPRVGRRLAVTYLVDGKRNEEGRFAQYAPPGEGDLDLYRYLMVIKGLAKQPLGMVYLPADTLEAGGGAEAVLPAAMSRLQEELKRIDEAPPLTAYKGDKKPTPFAPMQHRTPVGG